MTALDPYNNVATGYRGTIHFTSTDRLASLPNAYTFTAANNGVNSFVNGVTLRTTGTQTITATDLNNQSINGSASVMVRGSSPSVVFSSLAAIDDSEGDDSVAAWVAKPRQESRQSMKRQPGRSQALTPADAGSHRKLPAAVRSRTVAPRDAVWITCSPA